MSDCWWINGPRIPDVKWLSDARLIELWKKHRNGPLGYMAADEGMRRREEEIREEARTPRGNNPAKP